jgi:hypothetical protein
MSGTTGTPRHDAGTVAGGNQSGVPVSSGFVVPLADHITSTVLPGAGSFLGPNVAGSPLNLTPGTKRVTFWITYTRGAAGGYPAFRVFVNNNTTGGATFHIPVLDFASFVAAAEEGTTKFYCEELEGPPPPDANPLSYELTYTLPANARHVEIQVAERGVVGSPGTIVVKTTADG